MNWLQDWMGEGRGGKGGGVKVPAPEVTRLCALRNTRLALACDATSYDIVRVNRRSGVGAQRLTLCLPRHALVL